MSSLPAISDDFFDFINRHGKDDVARLLLQYRDKTSGFDLGFALVQIECRRKTAKKLCNFTRYAGFLFPDILAAEQSSNDAVAKFHSSLIAEGSSLLDMTAGLGIDVMSMSERCSQATAVEINPLKAEVLEYNCNLLGKSNIQVINDDSVDWLERSDVNFDCIFIDPARRGKDNSRSYNFRDCVPDILSTQDLILDRCTRLFIKASPLLDISQTVKDISGVKSIRTVCVNGECKEILVEASKSSQIFWKDLFPSESILKEAIDLDEDGKEISRLSYREIPASYADADYIVYASDDDIKQGHYLYEPNAGVMKLAPWNEICLIYSGMKKLAPSSHLFVSDCRHDNFPGRVLKIECLIEKKDRKALRGFPANVVVRNYPLQAAELRKQLGVREGSDKFIYGTRIRKPLLILASR